MQRVVGDKGQEHNPTLQKYFADANSDAPYLIADAYINIIAQTADVNNLTSEEKYAILRTHMSNVNCNSSAAEVEYYSDALTNWKSMFARWTESAIRADMAIGEEKEYIGGFFDDYYDLDRGVVNGQKEAHGEQ